jgi:hypothetical protein
MIPNQTWQIMCRTVLALSLFSYFPILLSKLVIAWIEIHQEDLLADWSLSVNGPKPFPIKGLDQ